MVSYYVWADRHVIDSKYGIGSWSILELLTFVALLIMFFFSRVPFWPSSLTSYAFVYHILHCVSWIIAIGIAKTSEPILVRLGLIYRAFTLFFDTLSITLLIFNLVRCWTGALPIECRETQFADIIISILAFTLFITSLFIVWDILNIVVRIRNATMPKYKTR